MSWAVLMKDRELILFPIMSAIGVIVVIGLFFGIAAATGTVDRLDTAAGSGTTEQTQAVDYILAILLYASSTFVVISRFSKDHASADDDR